MDRPLQAILMAGEKKRDDVIQGHKTTTIRLGHRDYRPGMAIVGCHVLGWCVGVNITVVEYYILKDTPLKLLHKNGYADLEDAIKDLKTIYPTIEPMSKITWVEWERTAKN
jgi:hypothetical protein